MNALTSKAMLRTKMPRWFVISASMCDSHWCTDVVLRARPLVGSGDTDGGVRVDRLHHAAAQRLQLVLGNWVLDAGVVGRTSSSA